MESIITTYSFFVKANLLYHDFVFHLEGHGPKFPDWAWALSEYIEWAEEEQVVVGSSNLKSDY